LNIKESSYIEKQAISIENDYLKAIVLPNEGSNLISLYDKVKGIELLRTPKTKQEFQSRRMVFGNPILFPPNRIEDAEFTFDNRLYKFPMNKPTENNHSHGVLHNKKWNVIERNKNKMLITTQLVSNTIDELNSIFPQSFVVELTFQLLDHCLFQSLSIKNNSSFKLPVLLGLHTNFYFSNKNSLLQMEVGKQWTFNERNLPTGERVNWPNQYHLKSGLLIKSSFDHEFEMSKSKTAIINHRHLGIQLEYEAIKGFNFWALFNGDGKQNYLAIEPYTCITNAPNLDMPHQLTGLEWIEPNDQKSYRTSITVKHT